MRYNIHNIMYIKMNDDVNSVVSSAELTRVDRLIYPILTKSVHIIYHFKTIINIFVVSVLGFIIVLDNSNDGDIKQKAYITVSIVIILSLLVDEYIRSISRLFDFSSSISQPVIIEPGSRLVKVVNYRRRRHLLTLFSIIIIEIVKLLSGIFCVIDLSIMRIDNVFLNYFLLAFLLLESILGFVTYLSAFIMVCFNRDSYQRWLNYMCEAYVRNIVNCIIYSRGTRLYMEMSLIDNI